MSQSARQRLQSWGTKARVQTGLKKYYDDLVAEYPDWFPTLTNLFEVSAALGISHGQQKELAKKEDLANVVNLDTAVFYVLMSLRFPDETPEGRLEQLERFAEYGVSKLYEETSQAGEVGFLQYLKAALQECAALA